MKLFLKRCVPFFVALGILASIGWYLLVYDREFTRDILISQARHLDSMGNPDWAAKLYDLAYDYTGKSEDVAIELANQYKADGNYTKAEYTLTNAIANGASVDLYVALSKTFVEQDKLQDAVAMLDSISDPAVKAEMDALRPAAPVPVPDPGFYSEYILVDFPRNQGKIYYTTNQEYPTLSQEPFSEPIALPGGETIIYAVTVDSNGLVSPLTIAGYTISGVIEEAVFADPAIELALREQLGLEEGETLMTDRLWDVREFTVPAEAQQLADLRLVPYLEKLTLQDYKPESLAFLTSLTSLKALDLTDCRISPSDLKYIAALPKLEKLSLAGCNLSTIADLSGSTSLKYLDLSRNTLRNLESLIPMSTLEELFLQHNAVTALDALAALTSLKKLDISYNSVSSLAPLAACTQLTWLDAGHNQLSSLSGIDTFPALTHLAVDHNQLRDVSILGKVTTLVELDVSYNKLNSLNELKTLISLTTLNCSNNEMTHLPIWPKDCALTTLDCSHNMIASLNPLLGLQELTYVYLDYNYLTTLDPLSYCSRIVLVNAYGNDISDVSALTDLDIIVNYDPTR